MMSSGLFLLLSAKSSGEVSCRFDLVTLIGVDVELMSPTFVGKYMFVFCFQNDTDRLSVDDVWNKSSLPKSPIRVSITRSNAQ